MKEQMLERLEKAAEELRQIFLEIDNMPSISDDWQERQRVNAVKGLSEVKQKLGFVHGYIDSFLPPQNQKEVDEEP